MTKSLVRDGFFEQGYKTIIFCEKYDLSVWIKHLFE